MSILPFHLIGHVADGLDRVPFHGDDVITTMINGIPHVFLKPVIDRLGVNYASQLRKLKHKSWSKASLVLVYAQLPGDIQSRQHVAMPVRLLPMLLATIDEHKVDPSVRPTLIALQLEVADVVEAYYFKGAAINPRVTPEQLPAVVDQAVGDYRSARETLIAEDKAERTALAQIATEQVQLLGAAASTGLIDSQWGKTKAQVVIARGLGETPAIPAAELPLYVEEFLRSKRVPGKKANDFSGAFGTKIKTEANLKGVPIPGKRLQELSNGDVREVTAWTKAHLPIFEQAWAVSGYEARLVPRA
jgi:hypothetical protein